MSRFIEIVEVGPRDGLQNEKALLDVDQKLAFIGASEMRSLTAANRQRIADSRNQLQHILDAAITRASRQGDVRGVPGDRRIAGRAIATMCTSLPQWFNSAGPSTPEETAHAYADFAVSLLTKQNGIRVD